MVEEVVEEVVEVEEEYGGEGATEHERGSAGGGGEQTSRWEGGRRVRGGNGRGGYPPSGSVWGEGARAVGGGGRTWRSGGLWGPTREDAQGATFPLSPTRSLSNRRRASPSPPAPPLPQPAIQAVMPLKTYVA